MRRPTSMRTSATDIVSPYRWGEHKWEDYLFDTQALLFDGAHAQIDATTGVRLAVESATTQQAAMLDVFQQHAADAAWAWNRITDQLDGLNETLVGRFTTLDHTLAYHGRLLQDLAIKLDRIVFALEHRLDTEAMELFENGRKLLARHLYPEALADLQASEAKRPVNPLLQLHLAQIHYHVRDSGVSFDYGIAEHHISLAIRYGRALREDLGPDGNEILDLVIRTAAHIAFLKGGDATKEGNVRDANAELTRSLQLLASIEEPSPHSRFLAARVHARLGNLDEATKEIRALADYTRSWIPRALLEPDLSALAAAVGGLGKDLASAPGPHSQTVREVAGLARTFADRAVSAAGTPVARGLSLGREVDEALERFESGVVDAPTARAVIISLIRRSRVAIRAELAAVVNQCDALALKYDADASALGASWAYHIVRYDEKYLELIGLTLLVVAPVVSVIIAIVSPATISLELLFVCEALAVAAFWWHHESERRRRKDIDSRREDARANRDAARRDSDAARHRVAVLTELEEALKLMSAPANGRTNARWSQVSSRHDADPRRALEVGKVYHGTVVSTASVGAFVRIAPDVEGLVVLSELADGRVERTEDVVEKGDVVSVKLLSIDSRGRIRLSLKAALPEDW